MNLLQPYRLLGMGLAFDPTAVRWAVSVAALQAAGEGEICLTYGVAIRYICWSLSGSLCSNHSFAMAICG